MAENTEMGEGARGYRVDVPRDAFVGRVVQDPKQPPNALLLTGFVGDSAEDGHLRLYSDPSLAQYVDVPEEAVLHSEPLPVDQSPLGGSHLWVRSDARLLPQAAGVQQQAGFLGGQLFQEQLAGAADIGRVPLQITLLTVAGCYTVRPWQCPIKSFWRPCIPPTVLEPHCFQVELPITKQWEQPVRGFQAQGFAAAAPPTPGCQPQGFQGFPAAQPAVSAQCQMSYGPCPTHLLGCPSTSTCPPTDAFGCPRTSTCPPTYMPGCPSTSTCPPGGEQGFGQVGQAGPGLQLTIATVCTQIGCQSLGIACTALSGCGCLPMTLGPVVPTQHMQICGGGPVVSAGRCPSAVDACPTRLCGGQFGGNPGF